MLLREYSAEVLPGSKLVSEANETRLVDLLEDFLKEDFEVVILRWLRS
jgi:hypothetical protein